MAEQRPGTPSGGSRTGATGRMIGGRYRLDQPLAPDLPGVEPWSATDTILDRPVRVDLVTGSRTPAALDAARRAALVSEPRLARILQVDQEGDLGIVVSSEIDGRTLAELAAAGPLPHDQARAIVGEVAAALEEARRRGLHHLALRPRSVLITPAGRVALRGLAVDGTLIGAADISAHAASRRDAIDLIRLLYAALTGHWPAPPTTTGAVPTFAEWVGAEGEAATTEPDPGLPAAPTADTGSVAPVDLVPGIPADLDTLCAVTLGPHDDGPHSPGEVVRELEPWRAVHAQELFRAADAGPAAGAQTREPSLGDAAAGAAAGGTGAAVAAAAVPASAPDATAPELAAPTGWQWPVTAAAPEESASAPASVADAPAWPALDDPRGDAPTSDAAASDTAASDTTASVSVQAPTAAPSTPPTGSSTMTDQQKPTPDEPTEGTDAPAAPGGSTPARQSVRASFASGEGAGARRPGTPPPAIPPRSSTRQSPAGSSSAARSAGGAAATGAGAAAAGVAAGGGSSTPATLSPRPLPSASGPTRTPSAAAARSSAAFPAQPTSAATTPTGGARSGASGAAASGVGAPGPSASGAGASGAAGSDVTSSGSGGGRTGGTGSGGSTPDWGLPFDPDAQRTTRQPRHQFDPTRWVLGLVGVGIVVVLVLAISTVTRPWGSGRDDEAATAATTQPAEAPTEEAEAPAEEEPAPPVAVAPVIAGITTIDPSDNDGEKEELIARIWDGDPNTAWYTHTYNRPDFAGFKDAVGIAITLTEPATVNEVTLQVNGAGGNVEVRATDAANPTAGEVLASGPLNGTTVLTLSQPTETQNIVLWFTALAQTPDGKNRIEISELSVG
ncbi:protein kinase family protein [Cellulomonas sp. NPDC089187]|uniref:protein kinase family protein n=1 Tax=Cellulomonas sp. NPDC089187 TaxID=3154970 RepID=UPI00342C3794